MRLNGDGDCEAIEYIGDFDEHLYLPPSCQWLYTAPPQREWVSLTDDEIQDLWFRHRYESSSNIARAIEAKLKEKNT